MRGLLTKNQYLLLSQKFPHDPQNEFLRVALIMFSLTILNERPKDCSAGRKICSIFNENFEGFTLGCGGYEEGAAGEVDFILWAVFLGVCVLRYIECEEKEWLVMTFRNLCMRGAVTGMEDLHGRLERFLWVEYIHSEWLGVVWDKMVGSG